MNPSEKSLTWIFIAGILVLATVIIGVIWQYNSLQGRGAGRVELMREYVARAQAIHPGRVTMTALDEEEERPVYKILIISKEGVPREFYFDVNTKELLNP